MMDYSVPQFRYFMRLVSQQTLLYTEMHVVNALIHMDGPKLRRALGRRRDNVERVALQIGGSDVDLTQQAVQRVWQDGYAFEEVNINCGCPSEKVSGAGMFGAALMDYPEQVAALARATADGIAAGTASHSLSQRHTTSAVDPAVTVKCRIGIARPSDFDEGRSWKGHAVGSGDKQSRRQSDPSVSRMLQYFRGEAPPGFTERRHNEQFERLCGFVETVSNESPATHFIVHAREAVRLLRSFLLCSCAGGHFFCNLGFELFAGRYEMNSRLLTAISTQRTIEVFHLFAMMWSDAWRFVSKWRTGKISSLRYFW